MFLLSDVQSVLSENIHPVYKRLIFLDGVFFSKSDLTNALQQYQSLRDPVLQKLCDQRILIKLEIFARKNSSDMIDYLDGYMKMMPTVAHDESSIQEAMQFAGVLAHYDVLIEQYRHSLIAGYRSMRIADTSSAKYVLSRSDIKLKSYLFSFKFAEFINANKFYSDTFIIDPDALCTANQSMISHTSNIRTSAFLIEISFTRQIAI